MNPTISTMVPQFNLGTWFELKKKRSCEFYNSSFINKWDWKTKKKKTDLCSIFWHNLIWVCYSERKRKKELFEFEYKLKLKKYIFIRLVFLF